MSDFKLGKNQLTWIAALRSGKYKQTRNCLHNENGFCCLGVGADISKVGRWETRRLSTKTFQYATPDALYPAVGTLEESGVDKWLGLYSKSGSSCDRAATSLFMLNDTGKSFEQIANILETHPELYFKESK